MNLLASFSDTSKFLSLILWPSVFSSFLTFHHLHYRRTLSNWIDGVTAPRWYDRFLPDVSSLRLRPWIKLSAVSNLTSKSLSALPLTSSSSSEVLLRLEMTFYLLFMQQLFYLVWNILWRNWLWWNQLKLFMKRIFGQKQTALPRKRFCPDG